MPRHRLVVAALLAVLAFPSPASAIEGAASPNSAPAVSASAMGIVPSAHVSKPSAPAATGSPATTGSPVEPSITVLPEDPEPASSAPRPRTAKAPASNGAAGRRDYIVVFRDSADVAAKVSGFAHSLAVRASHAYSHVFKGFAAPLTAAQYRKVAADPSVAYIIPDRATRVEGQIIPTGVMRVGALGDTPGPDSVLSPVDADIAIVDTGIQPNHPDLNVVGGHSCNNPNPRYWGDVYGHGTHVAGTAAALDNGVGVVGVAPGARLWSVKVFDDAGNGRISWYACGLDWIAAQRDPTDPTRPLFEVANMSLRTIGSNDNDCGNTNHDPLHRAICRTVSRGTTVVVAAGNDHASASNWVPASYPEVITVSALADFNGQPGGGAPSTCSSWGSADSDDTFANFSNYGWVVDMMASGKCIVSTFPGSRYKLMSGTSMATPAVSGGVAIWKALHPDASPATVKAVLKAAGRYDWFWSTDPDIYHERMLNVSSFGQGPSFAVGFSSGTQAFGAAGGTARYTVQLTRNDAFMDQVDLSVSDLPAGATASFSPSSLSGLGGLTSILSVHVPVGLPEGTYTPVVTGTSGAETHSENVRLVIDLTPPVPSAPRTRLVRGWLGQTQAPVRVYWSASDPRGIGGYELQVSKDGGTYGRVGFYSGSVRSTALSLFTRHDYKFRVRARDRVGNLSGWATAGVFRIGRFEQTSTLVSYRGSWRGIRDIRASCSSLTYSTQFAATATFRFTGTQVAWVTSAGPKDGYVMIYLDGEYITSLTLYQHSWSFRRIAFTGSFAASAVHTITIWVRAPAGHPRIDVDAFLVLS